MQEGEPKKRRLQHIQGLVVQADFISQAQEAMLLEHIDAAEWNTTLKRRTQHYGYEYDYTSRGAKKTHPIPEYALGIAQKLVDDGLIKQLPDQLIINEYKPGQGIAAHVDKRDIFGDEIVSISLGAEVPMVFTRGTDTQTIPLARRSAVILTGEDRYAWSHAIEGKKQDNGVPRGTRVSMTFRKMKLVKN